MSDRIEALIAEQLATNLFDRLTKGPRWIGSDEFPAVLTEEARAILAALTAARIAVVDLAAPDANGEWENQPEWWVGTDHDYGTGWVVPHTGRIRLMPDTARSYAAALLAAADAAEAPHE